MAQLLSSALRRISGVLKRTTDDLGAWWAARFGPKVRVEACPDVPRDPRRLTLYVRSGPDGPTFGAMRCPCGCGDLLNLRFFGDRRPRWRLEIDHEGRPTIHPSVWRQTGCRSHFFLRGGRIDWCD